MRIVDYTEHNPNPKHLLEHFRSPYRAVGWERITVPAGTFDAMKIEPDGTWEAVVAPRVSASTGATASAGSAVSVSAVSRTSARRAEGRSYKAFWYVPSVRRWAKSEEDYHSSKGDRSSAYTTELTSFKPAGR